MRSLDPASPEFQELLDRLRELDPDLLDALLDHSNYARRSARLNVSAIARSLGRSLKEVRSDLAMMRIAAPEWGEAE